MIIKSRVAARIFAKKWQGSALGVLFQKANGGGIPFGARKVALGDGIQTRHIAVVAKIRELDGAGNGVFFDSGNVVHIRNGLIVRHQGNRLADLIGKTESVQIIDGIRGVLYEIMQKGDDGRGLVRHLLGQVKGVEYVGHPTFVDLLLVGVKAELERDFCHFRVNHITNSDSDYFFYFSTNARGCQEKNVDI